MIKWIAGIAAGLVWCVLVFAVTWYVTFPSQAIVDRAAYEVQTASNGSMALKASSSSPWWTGVSLSDVTLLSVKDNAGSPVLVAESVSARTSLFSLLGGGLPIHGVVDLGGSLITIDAEVDRTQNPPALQKITADAPAFSVQAIGALLAPLGASMKGTGDLELDLDLEVGENVKGHDGRLKFDGKSLMVDLSVPDPISGGLFNIGEINVGEIDFVFDVKDGKAIIKKGMIRSDSADIDLDLTITLNEKMGRSRLRGTLVLANIGGNLATYEMLMKDAKWPDGKYHYAINCSIDRFDAKCLRAERQRTVRTPRTPVGATEGDEDAQDRREKARIEREERRKQRLEERGATNAGSLAERPGSAPGAAGADEDDEDDEDLDDEEDEEPQLPDNIELIDPMIVAPLSPLDPSGVGIPNRVLDRGNR